MGDQKTTNLNFDEAIAAVSNGFKVKLPEWTGYWFTKESAEIGKVHVMMGNGDIVETPWEDERVLYRTDFLITDGKLGFDWAIRALKNGKAVRRSGWNGKGMFIVKQVPCVIGTDIIPKMQSLPDSAKTILLDRDQSISYTNQMLIVNASGRADSWVPSSSDCFEEDWELAN